MNPKLILGGIKSYAPWFCDFRGTGGSTSAAYCYSVWLRHLVLMQRHGLSTTPQAVVELGPGDSIGVGLAALLCGAKRYRALDVVTHSDPARDAIVLDGLRQLFEKRSPIPGDDACPGLFPKLESYSFPAHILDEARLEASLSESRLHELQDALRVANGSTDTQSAVRYVCPWTDTANIEVDSADLVLSHVVLQDIVDLPPVFAAMRRWLRPGGVMSQQINFASPDKTGPWNNHWTYPDPIWRVVRGNRPYYENREPLSTYLRLFADHGFEIIAVTSRNEVGHARHQLGERFQSLNDTDMTTSAAHIFAVRR